MNCLSQHEQTNCVAMRGSGTDLPNYSTLSAAVSAEGPVRDLLRAVQKDDNTRDTVPAEWLKQLSRWIEATIDGAHA